MDETSIQSTCLKCRTIFCNIPPSAVCDIGSASFKYDMRRLSEILAFPRAWYRRSIARRLFLGDQTINLPGDLSPLSTLCLSFFFTTLMFCRKYLPALCLFLCQCRHLNRAYSLRVCGATFLAARWLAPLPHSSGSIPGSCGVCTFFSGFLPQSKEVDR